MADFNLGTVTAYGYARDKGYTGTEAEFAELMASYAQVAEDAAESAEQAAQSATTATTKAGEAATSATNAANANTAAQAAKTGAETAAQTATTKADEASGSATTASTKATEAATSATSAAQSATTATTKAGEASTSATNAAASASAAAGSAQTAQDVADSIPADYTQLSEDVSTLKEDKADIDSVYVTDTASGSIASFPDGADNVPVKNLTVNIEPVQSGSGDPSPTNIRPISGWTQAKVTRTGVNIAKGVEVGTGTNMYVTALYIDCELKPSTFYMLSFDGLSGQNFYANENVFSWTSVTVGDARATLLVKTRADISKSSPSQYSNNKWVVLKNNAALSEAPVINNVQLEVGATASEYEEPHVQTVTIDLGDTIYGGTLDVATGVLTVDRATAVLNGSESWQKHNVLESWFYLDDPFANAYKSYNDSDFIISNAYAQTAYVDVTRIENGHIALGGDAYTRFVVKDTRYTTVADFVAYLNTDNLQIVYRLATPFEVQLTAQEVRTLLGTNNIWSDAGNVEVEYRADTKLYIQKVLNA